MVPHVVKNLKKTHYIDFYAFGRQDFQGCSNREVFMRIANVHNLPIMPDREVALTLSREVFERCAEEFEWLASTRRPLKLQLSTFDVFVIEKHYPISSEGLEIKLAAVIEDMLSGIEMKYVLFPIMRPDRSTLVFYSRVVYRRKK